MDCWHPLELPNKGYNDLRNKVAQLERVMKNYEFYPLYWDVDVYSLHDKLSTLLDYTPEFIKCPCRKCPPCLKKRSNEWSGRLMREALYWLGLDKKCLFVTLSYSPKYIKSARRTYKEDLAKFFDRLRSKYRRNIRHWCIPELGEKSGRFHIHALLFDVPDDFAPDSHFHRSKNGAVMGSNKIISERWRKGIVDVGFLKHPRGANYMVSYLTKISEASLKANNGFMFKGGIVCSNKIGFLNSDEAEVLKVVEQVQHGINAHYQIGSFRFSYPLSWLNKNITPLLLRYSSYNNSLVRYFKGGDFVFHQKYYSTYSEYRSVLNSALRGTQYYYLPQRLSNSIDINELFDFENIF